MNFACLRNTYAGPRRRWALQVNLINFPMMKRANCSIWLGQKKLLWDSGREGLVWKDWCTLPKNSLQHGTNQQLVAKALLKLRMLSRFHSDKIEVILISWRKSIREETRSVVTNGRISLPWYKEDSWFVVAAGALGLGFNIATNSGWFQNFQSWGHWYLSHISQIIWEHILLDWQVVAGIN